MSINDGNSDKSVFIKTIRKEADWIEVMNYSWERKDQSDVFSVPCEMMYESGHWIL